MTTALELAFPKDSNWLAATVRSKLAECGIFVSSTASLGGEDFTIQPWAAIAVRGNNASLETYAYDSADTTTADDGGVSCIVVSGRRYKKRIDVLLKDAAISGTVTAQPASPTLGDTYIVPAAPTGTDWASKAKTVATYTARGWIFRQPFVGMLVYAADVDGFYTYKSSGVWAQGLPIGALADGSITPKKLFYAFSILKVEDQRNAPPGGTPTVGTMYQVGTSPTGAFAGHTNEIARWNALAAWEFMAPAEGDIIYRKDVSVLYAYRSGAWGLYANPPSIFQVFAKTQTLSASNSSSIPTTLISQVITAPAGSKVKMTVAYVGGIAPSGSSQFAWGIRIDTASTLAVGSTQLSNMTVYCDVPDASAHTYSLAVARALGSATLNISSTVSVIFEVFTPN